MPKEKTQRNQKLFDDWKNGMSYYQLARKYDMSQPVAYRKVQRLRKREKEKITV